MPPVSERQRRAMHAAASGNSTLGIPQSVGQEFSEADTGGKLPQTKKKSRSKKNGRASGGANRSRSSSKRKKGPYDYLARY